MPFFDIEPEFLKRTKARFVILPVPYERTTTYLKGCADGPDAIRIASPSLEMYEYDVDIEPFRAGIFTAPSVQFGDADEKTELEKIGKAAALYVDDGKFLISIGGEHSISLPLLKLFASRYKDLSVLQIDAHPDLRDSYNGSQFNHACVARRMIEFAPIVQVGIRSWCFEQEQYMRNAQRNKVNGRKALTFFPADQIVGKEGWQKKVLNSLSDNVYLTVDIDGFDPSIFPAVGTPEPGGLGWYETLDLFKNLVREKRLVGMDLVELKPIKGETRSEVAAARLIHHVISYLIKHKKSP